MQCLGKNINRRKGEDNELGVHSHVSMYWLNKICES